MDPDDFIALNLLLSHPSSELKAILLSPGYPDQVELVEGILDFHGQPDIAVGTIKKNLSSTKKCVTPPHFGCLQRLNVARGRARDVNEGYELLEQTATRYPGIILITTGPLKNFRYWAIRGKTTIVRSCTMGGYMGDLVLGQPLTMPEFNFNGDPGGAHQLVVTPRIGRKVFVSKNVTHHVFYTAELHDAVKNLAPASRGHRMICEMMTAWQSKHHDQLKKLHDPLTVCVALDESIVQLREVELFKDHGEWGAREKKGTNCFITYGNQTHVDLAKFIRIFLQCKDA